MPAKPEANTVPVTIRMNRETRDRLLAFGARFPFKLTLTQLVDSAVREYLERHDKSVTPPSHPQPSASRGKR